MPTRPRPTKPPALHAQIRTARLAAGLSQEALAAALGHGGNASVSRWETGARLPSLRELGRLAALCGARVEVRVVPCQGAAGEGMQPLQTGHDAAVIPAKA